MSNFEIELYHKNTDNSLNLNLNLRRIRSEGRADSFVTSILPIIQLCYNQTIYIPVTPNRLVFISGNEFEATTIQFFLPPGSRASSMTSLPMTSLMGTFVAVLFSAVS